MALVLQEDWQLLWRRRSAATTTITTATLAQLGCSALLARLASSCSSIGPSRTRTAVGLLVIACEYRRNRSVHRRARRVTVDDLDYEGLGTQVPEDRERLWRTEPALLTSLPDQGAPELACRLWIKAFAPRGFDKLLDGGNAGAARSSDATPCQD